MLKRKKFNLKQTKDAWVKLSPSLTVIKSEAQYKRAVEFLDYLIDEVRDSTVHPLASLMEVVGTLIQSYEDTQNAIPEGDPIATLKHLLKSQGLTQKDLPQVGSQGVVSEILKGRRKLNVRQITALAKRFDLSPNVFLG